MTRLMLTCLFASFLSLAGCQSDPAPAPPGSAESSQPAVPDELKAFKPVVGLSLEAAKTWLDENPTFGPKSPEVRVDELRATWIDGESLTVSSDFRQSRLNVALEKGLISALEGVH